MKKRYYMKQQIYVELVNILLREGFAKLKTRESAAKYNLKTSACGYPKEINIALELQNIFSKELGDKIAFARNDI